MCVKCLNVLFSWEPTKFQYHSLGHLTKPGRGRVFLGFCEGVPLVFQKIQVR